MQFGSHLHTTGQKIAVIGAGISGLSAAWLAAKQNDVTLFEADSRPGGHANTVDVSFGSKKVAVDTGFIVFNERNYPNLTALFSHLDVTTEPSDMSFSASLNDGAFEYAGSNIATMFAQKSNLLRFSFWRMLYDIFRFYRDAPEAARRAELENLTLGNYLDARGYSRRFVEDHILPMGAAIWSTTPKNMRAYPLIAFTRFFESHGLLAISDRPAWRTVAGGSRSYIRRMLDDFSGTLRLSTPVTKVERRGRKVRVSTTRGETEIFDTVIIATHGNQALNMLADPTSSEYALLSAFRYTQNDAVLHSDEALMPKRRKVWSSWNYIDTGGDSTHRLCVTYWMNQLQTIDPAFPLFVTLNPGRPIAADRIHARFSYSHPLFDRAAVAAQRELWTIQGNGNVWFAGAHFGSGFHEDGLQSGLAAAEAATGILRPWSVESESGRIFLSPREPLMAAE
ncbi:FAD-dependent oxidoreductase [Martelella alba]|uniref:FAD-dependent oxidoreductase n=1 Tax=Martelella alba TaxID=2590451 RepID=A0A506UJ25_9HYPH|nr:FAD-dependent oxidoreductase [Martelella alba]TPW33263.1 FAD-dependent oxidoreductase [Martelella alba]